MGVIQILPEILANKIAAGEVIERPASIVKELVENALDAGAKTIEVNIAHGGKSLIRVADDGSGMAREDVELAFSRHATSKIKHDEDLESILTYGFRGEALPSMAAVSRILLISRKPDSPSGTEILIEGGKTMHVKESACRPGTIVEVRDLFFNTPARRKFLRSDATEHGHVLDVISNMALARLDVHFLFKSGDQNIILDLLPADKLKDRAARLLGGESAKHLLEFETESSGTKISGVIGKPSMARANRMGQTFFVNQRWVKAFSLSYALQAGYHGRLMHHQHPVGVILIEVDPKRVDVNVHPTKQEVRLSNEPAIKNLLQEAVSKRLAREPDLSPQLQTASLQEEVSWSASASGTQEAFPAIVSEPEMISFAKGSSAAGETARLAFEIPPSHGIQVTKVLGQIHHTFIAAETTEGLLLIDQHAAHERVQFEALVKNFKTGHPVKQRLLMDEVVTLHPKQIEIVEEALPVLEKLGFEIDRFGKDALIVRSLPAILSDESPESLLRTYLEEKEDGKLTAGLDAYQEDAAAMIACKRRSVKAHDVMTQESIQQLVRQLFQCENPFGCPHGRPSFLKYSFSDLEKQFKRKL